MRRWAAILLFGILACKSGSRDDTPPGVPTVTLSSGTVTFTLAMPRFFSEQDLTISNPARVPLRVFGVVSSSPVFQPLPQVPVPFDVSPARSHTIRVRFVPPGEGSFTGTLAITTDDPIRPSVSVALSGTAVLGGTTSFGGLSFHPDISLPVAVPSVALVAAAGPDAVMGTADDVVIVLRDTSPPTIAALPVPFIANRPVYTGGTTFAVPKLDPDGPGPLSSGIESLASIGGVSG